MSRMISVEVLLDMIDRAQGEFAVNAVSTAPDPVSAHAAHYHYGVWRGMETVKLNVLNKMKEEDEQRKPEAARVQRAY